jgi:hypothetical protein
MLFGLFGRLEATNHENRSFGLEQIDHHFHIRFCGEGCRRPAAMKSAGDSWTPSKRISRGSRAITRKPSGVFLSQTPVVSTRNSFGSRMACLRPFRKTLADRTVILSVSRYASGDFRRGKASSSYSGGLVRCEQPPDLRQQARGYSDDGLVAVVGRGRFVGRDPLLLGSRVQFGNQLLDPLLIPPFRKSLFVHIIDQDRLCDQEKQSLSQSSTRPIGPCTIARSFSYDSRIACALSGPVAFTLREPQ